MHTRIIVRLFDMVGRCANGVASLVGWDSGEAKGEGGGNAGSY